MLTASHIANVPANAADRSSGPIGWLYAVRVCGFAGSGHRGLSNAMRQGRRKSKSKLKPV